MRLEARGGTVHANGTTLLHPLALTLDPGPLAGGMGPTGAGQTTLVRVLAPLRPPHGGGVLEDGAPASQLGRTTLARHRASLAQGASVPWPLTVAHRVGLGWRPSRRLGRQDASTEARAVTAARRAPETEARRHRTRATLSGGERRRGLRALAVEAAALVADAPIAALDPDHQLQVMAGLRETAGRGPLVVGVLHDLPLAARFGDRLVLLNAGCVVAAGAPDGGLSAVNLPRVSRVTVVRTTHDSTLSVVPWSRHPEACLLGLRPRRPRARTDPGPARSRGHRGGARS